MLFETLRIEIVDGLFPIYQNGLLQFGNRMNFGTFTLRVEWRLDYILSLTLWKIGWQNASALEARIESQD